MIARLKAKPRRAFELRVIPRARVGYGLVLAEVGDGPTVGASVRLWGDPLRVLFDAVLACLRDAGYRPSDLRASRAEPFVLDEETGVRLGLLFRALKPMRNLSRMEAVAGEVRGMAPEEVYYWWAKTGTPECGRRAERALRVLLSRE